MKYSLATNFDDSLIDYVNEYDTEKKIKSVYGKLKRDILGGGRSSILLPQLSLSELENYIAHCHKVGLEFNYLFNPMCLDNKDVDRKEQNKILSFIDQLVEIGIDAITLNSPYMCRVIRKRYPNIKITIGAYAVIYSIQQVNYWREMGADEVTLHHKVNRDFKLLESMLNHFKGKDINLRLIGNNVCLKDCPFQISHGTEQAHVSKDGDRKLFFDVDLISCTYKKVDDFTRIISSEWIRPEDVKIYDELCQKCDNPMLSIKLVERTKETEVLKRTVKAYIDESYDGNLLDILNWPKKQEVKKLDEKAIALGIMFEGYNIKKAKMFNDVFDLPEIFIDNNKLDHFIDHFIDANACMYKSCSNGFSNEKNECDYCASWAKKAVSFDAEKRNRWLEFVGSFLSYFDDRSIFK